MTPAELDGLCAGLSPGRHSSPPPSWASAQRDRRSPEHRLPEDRARSSPTTPLETLQAWQAFNVVDQAAPYLSKRFVDAHFEFRGKELAGQPRAAAALEARRRSWSTARSAKRSARSMSPATSRRSPRPRWRTWSATCASRAARPHREARLDDARDQGQGAGEARQFSVKIGYPDKWRDYSALEIEPADLYGNVRRAAAFRMGLSRSASSTSRSTRTSGA